MSCLKILYMNVYGMEMKRVENNDRERVVYTGRRVKEVWKDEGEEEDEERRRWERRWREGMDIMSEEDVMETSVMHLCIPDYKKKEKWGYITPDFPTYYALTILLNEVVNLSCMYHFPVYDLSREFSNVVIIRNLPERFDIRFRNALTTMIESICPVISIHSPRVKGERDYRWHSITHTCMRVTLESSAGAKQVVKRMDGMEFEGVYLSVRQGMKQEEEEEIYIPPLSPYDSMEEEMWDDEYLYGFAG